MKWPGRVRPRGEVVWQPSWVPRAQNVLCNPKASRMLWGSEWSHLLPLFHRHWCLWVVLTGSHTITVRKTPFPFTPPPKLSKFIATSLSIWGSGVTDSEAWTLEDSKRNLAAPLGMPGQPPCPKTEQTVGSFYFPGWTPATIPLLSGNLAVISSLRPTVVIFFTWLCWPTCSSL